MNLSVIKDFFTGHANVEEVRIKKISSFLSVYPGFNLFSLFKQISMGSASHLNSLYMKKYMSQFNNNLQIIDPNEINRFTTSKDLGSKIQQSDQQVIEKGISLFLNNWGNSIKQISFAQFSKFMKDEECLPQKAEEIPYHAKKKLYQIIESEIQGLLNIETLRQVCIKEYKNLTDLFEIIADLQTNQITKNSIQNLYLMHSERMNESFLNRISKRLSLPMSFENFIQIFKKDLTGSNPKVTQRKVYYSSARRNKAYQPQDYLDEDNISNQSNSRIFNFQTPQSQKVGANRGLTSTKLTKGQKISDLKHASVNVSKFKLMDTPEGYRKSQQSPYQSKQIQILGEILSIEQAYIQLKRNLCLKKDFDLELVYERCGIRFEQLLNQIYGVCNFTSFVRFIVPQDFEHRYLSFIRHQTSNVLSHQTLSMVDELLQTYERKQTEIEILWSKIDRQMIFRMYCNPCDQSIRGEELNKYFTERQSKILIDRMDPFKTGYIQFQNFR